MVRGRWGDHIIWRKVFHLNIGDRLGDTTNSVEFLSTNLRQITWNSEGFTYYIPETFIPSLLCLLTLCDNYRRIDDIYPRTRHQNSYTPCTAAASLEAWVTLNTVRLRIFRHDFAVMETRFIASLQDLNVNRFFLSEPY